MSNNDHPSQNRPSLQSPHIMTSELMLQQALNTIPIRVFWKDLDGVFLGCNTRFAQDAGFQSPAELIGKKDFDLVWHEQAELYRADDQFVIQTEEAKLNYEEPQTTPDNQQIWLRTSKIPFRDQNNQIIGVLGLYEDITERKRSEQEKKDLITDLEAQKSELERYAYTISHDLKSPLITIKGFLSVLEKDAIEGNLDNIYQDAAFINDAVDKMAALLDDLLQLSRIGRIVSPPEEISMSALAFEAVTLVQNQIQTRRVEVSITSDEIMGFVDPVRIREVFQNLIENAVKFMGDQENPVVEIGARYDGEFTECHVRDNGIGINPSYHDVIFGLFERLDPNVNGTGVGLAIVKRIVESQGGRIWLESEGENMGTTFYFTVPAPK